MTDLKLDPRRNAYRADLANIALKNEVTSAQFTEGRTAWVVDPAAPVKRAPRFDAPLDTQALYGEQLTVFDKREGWAWVQLSGDDYVGYLPENSISHEPIKATHRISAQRTFLFPKPNIKAPPLCALPLNARVEIINEETDFLLTKQGAFLHKKHVSPIDSFDMDYVTVAERFVETPYLWGGKQDTGIDCSGLVQTSMEAVGIHVPRDSDMQASETGKALPKPFDLTSLRRGDLIFWKGHVGIMADKQNLLHANAFHMKTVIEPLADAVKRSLEAGNEITAIRRP